MNFGEGVGESLCGFLLPIELPPSGSPPPLEIYLMHDCAHAYGTSQWDFDCGKLHILQNSTFERWRECPPLREWCAIRRQRCPNEKRIWHQQLNGVSTFLALSVMSLFASSFQRGRRDRNIKNDRQASRYTDRQGLMSGV